MRGMVLLEMINGSSVTNIGQDGSGSGGGEVKATAMCEEDEIVCRNEVKNKLTRQLRSLENRQLSRAGLRDVDGGDL